jgi:uncharacterized membrane protein YtjA (UPF0391 family)
MLKWAFVFLLIAIAQWLFGIFLVLFIGALIIGLAIGARLTS